MTDSASDPSNTSPLHAEDRLPPVEPPSGSFIMQLFLIPMLIVGVVVMVWLMFSWLAQMDNRPEELLNDLERLNHSSWQKALTLANNLSDPKYREMRRDPQVARRLANVLQKHIDQQQLGKEAIDLRVYLCHALGNFEVPEVLPALLSAATTERDTKEITVRRSAVWAIGQVAEHLGAEQVLAHPDVFAAIKSASEEFGDGDELVPRGRLRSTAAVVLGKLGSSVAMERLVEMLVDPYPDTRYNAAVALADQGSVAANDTLLEMLDIENEEVVKYEKGNGAESNGDNPDRIWKRQDVILQTLRAVRALHAKNADADLSEIAAAVRAVVTADMPNKIQIEALAVARELENRERTTTE